MRPITGTITDRATDQLFEQPSRETLDEIYAASEEAYDPILQESDASKFTLDQYQALAAETAMYPRVYTEAQVAAILEEALIDAAGYSNYAIEGVTERLLKKYETPFNRLVYPLMGLAGEIGEILNKAKKVARDDQGQMDLAAVEDSAAELGDVGWYFAAIATELGVKLGAVARGNIRKLQSRKARGVLGGSGDDR